MKKILSNIICLICILFMFVSCSNTDNSQVTNSNLSTIDESNVATSETTNDYAADNFPSLSGSQDSITPNKYGWISYMLPISWLSEEANIVKDDIKKIVDYSVSDEYNITTFVAFKSANNINTYAYLGQNIKTNAMVLYCVDENSDGTTKIYTDDYHKIDDIIDKSNTTN